MTKKDILELKRRMKKEACTFTKLCGCYVEMRAAVKKNYCPNIERKWDKIS